MGNCTARWLFLTPVYSSNTQHILLLHHLISLEFKQLLTLKMKEVIRFDMGEREWKRNEFAQLDNKTSVELRSDQFNSEVRDGFHQFPHKYSIVGKRINQRVDLLGMMEIGIDIIEQRNHHTDDECDLL